jgi:hypothetical protein
MKKAIIAVASLLVSLSAFAQGQVNFNTHITSGTIIDARVFKPDGTTAETAGFGQLFIVGAGNVYTPLTPAGAFKTSAGGAGYINAGAATAPAGFGNGTTVSVVLRAWEGSAGSTFDTAQIKGESAPISVTLVEAPGTPNDLVGLQGFTLTGVPEPTTLALGAIGLGALLIRRRK